jgi:hypothetical protein
MVFKLMASWSKYQVNTLTLNHEKGLSSQANILTLGPKWVKDQFSTVILILF